MATLRIHGSCPNIKYVWSVGNLIQKTIVLSVLINVVSNCCWKSQRYSHWLFFSFHGNFFTIINPNYHFEVTYNSKEKFQFTFGLTFNNLFLLSAVVRGDEPDDERDVQLQTVQLSQERTRQVLQPFLSRNHLQFGRILSLCPTRRFARRTQCPPRNAVLDIIQF